MNSLSPSTPTVLVMVGAPGAGKSFFANQFASTFKAPLVSQDQLRQTVSPQSQYNREENKVIDKLADNQLSELLKTGKTVVYDANANNKTRRQELRALAKQNGYQCLFVWAQVDQATAQKRSVKPNKRAAQYDPNKVPLTEQQFAQAIKDLTPLSHDETYLVISGKHTYATQAKVVLKNLSHDNREATGRLGGQQNYAKTKSQGRNIFVR